MSTCNHLLNLHQEKICYVHCSFCTTILLVSVPCNSLSKVVTVRCGHCTGLLTVNMVRASFIPLHLLTPLNGDEQEVCHEEVVLPRNSLVKEFHMTSPMMDSPDNNEKERTSAISIVKKPPEKRQRAPSAYNHFVKEEIQRLKTTDPNITHKEAFSTAAKNWAHFPRIQQKVDGESCSHGGGTVTRNLDFDEVNVQNKDFPERKASRHSVWAKTSFK